MTFLGFLGPPFEQVQFLPLMTFCLFLGPTHFFLRVSSTFWSRTGPNFTPYDILAFLGSPLLNKCGFTPYDILAFFGPPSPFPY